MHWVARNVSNMLDSSDVLSRTSDFTSSETRIERGQAILLNENDIPSDRTIIQDSAQQDRMLPQPTKAPTAPTPHLNY
jgi:hypothetical protein